MLSPETIQKYTHPEIGRTEQLIRFVPQFQNGRSQTPETVFTEYQFSNIKTGLKPMKRLLRNTVEQKLTRKFIWDSRIWQEVVVIQVQGRLVLGSDMTDAVQGSEIGAFLNRKLGNRRTEDIIKYRKKYEQNEILGKPVFVSGSVLNRLGGHVGSELIFMLDGARRMTAMALAGVSETDILLIERSETYMTLQELNGTEDRGQ